MTIDEAINNNCNLLTFMEIENKKNPDYQFSEDNFTALKIAIDSLALLKSKLDTSKMKLEENEWLVVRYDPYTVSAEHLHLLFNYLDKELRQKSIIMQNDISTSIQTVSDIIILFGQAVKKLEEIYQ